jgi:toxin-antitoxin system, toxin component, bro family
MNSIQVFNNTELGAVRTLSIEGEPWFVGKDIAEALGYVETANMRKLLDEYEYKEIDPQNAQFAGFVQNGRLEPNKNVRRMLLVNESGLYSAIFSSTLENAKKFKRWVTSEVLPSIRRTGSYKVENLESVNTAINILSRLLDDAGCSSEIKLLTAKQIYERAGIAIDYDIKADNLYYDTEQIARKLGIYVKSSGKPASKAVNEIIRRIDVDAKDCMDTWEKKGNWQGTVTKYNENIINRAGEWLKENNYPKEISYKQSNGECKTYYVVYA